MTSSFYNGLLFFALLYSSCTNPHQSLQRTWMLQHIDFEAGLEWLPSISTQLLLFGEDSMHTLTIYSEAEWRWRPPDLAYKLLEKDGTHHELVTGIDSLHTLVVRVYPNRLVFYPDNGTVTRLVFTPLLRFEQGEYLQRVQTLLTPRLATLVAPSVDTTQRDTTVLEFIDNRRVLFPKWLDLRYLGTAHWNLNAIQNELFLSWTAYNGSVHTFQIVEVHDHFLRLWNNQRGTFSTLYLHKNAALQKADFVGYWKEVNVAASERRQVFSTTTYQDSTPLLSTLPLSYSNTDQVRLFIMPNSMRTLLASNDRSATWRLSPSGQFWYGNNIFREGSRAFAPTMMRVELLNKNTLEVVLLYRYKEGEEAIARHMYLFERVDAAVFLKG